MSTVTNPRKKQTSFETNEVELKLTSVYVIPEIFIEFRKEAIGSPINFQKLVNRSLSLYNESKEFRDLILSHTKLVTKGKL